MSDTTKDFSNADEVKKFTSFAEDWWNPDGKMKPLHRFNPIRVDYIVERLCKAFDRDINALKPLHGLKILDVGCGGGLLSESLALQGADVVGIDATEKMIAVATRHARENNVEVDYRFIDVQEIANTEERFDAVMALEVIEHVNEPEKFIQICSACLKKGGQLFVSTINRTLKSYAFAIVGAEYILRWLPKGTHDWNKFLKPSEIVNMLRPISILPSQMVGITYNPLEDAFKVNEKDLSINYIIHFEK